MRSAPSIQWVREYWTQIVFAFSVVAVVYSTIKTVEAHAFRIDRLEAMSAATYINATLACVQSKAVGCVMFDELERTPPRLQVPRSISGDQPEPGASGSSGVP